MARPQGAEVINFNEDDPVKTIKELAGGIGVDRSIDAVGVDGDCAKSGPATKPAKQTKKEAEQEVKEIEKSKKPKGGRFTCSGIDLVRAGVGKGRDFVDHRCLFGAVKNFSYWHDDEQEHNHQGRELSPPAVHSRTPEVGAWRSA